MSLAYDIGRPLRSSFIFIASFWTLYTAAQTNWSPAAVFGTNGVTNTDISTGPDEMIRHHLLGDGRILLAGGGSENGCNCNYISLMRADTACGGLDPTFGTNGKVRHVFEQRSSLTDMVVLPDGKLLACGQSSVSTGPNDYRGAVYRFNADGSPDETLLGGGFVPQRFGPTLSGSHIAVLPMNNGRFAVVGGTFYTNNNSWDGRGVMRYNADGTLDNQYSGDGMHWIQNIGGPYVGQAGLMQADSSVLWIGTDASTGHSIYFTRFAMDGSTSDHVTSVGPGNYRGLSAKNIGNGKFLVGYSTDAGICVVARFNSDLTLDGTYGVGGTSEVDPTIAVDQVYGLEVLEDGSSLHFGGATWNSIHFVIKRTPDGALDATFGDNGVLRLPSSPAITGVRGGTILTGGESLLIHGLGGSSAAMITKMTTRPELNALPVISVEGEQLVVSGSGDVQWWYEGLPIAGATSPSIGPLDEGTYVASRAFTDQCVFDAPAYDLLGNHLFSVTPATVSTNNTHILRLHGSFYFDTATVVLRQGATEYIAHRVSVNDVLELAAVITLTEAPLGAYDVIIYREGYADTLLAAVQVVLPVSDVVSALQIELIGPWRTLANVDQIHTIRMHNPTGEAALGATVHLLVDGDVEIELLNAVIEEGYTDSMRNNHMHQRDFFRTGPIEGFIADSVTFGWFAIPYIPAGGFQDIQFRIRAGQLGYYELHALRGRMLLTDQEIQDLELLRTSCDFLPNFVQCLLDLVGQLPVASCVTSALSVGCAISNTAGAAVRDRSELASEVINLGADVLGLLTCEAGAYAESFIENEIRSLLVGAAGGLTSMISNVAAGEAPDIGIPGAFTLVPASCIDTHKEGPWVSKKRTAVLFSIDPNEKRGPVGLGAERYIHRNKQMDYTISFENDPSATAPAREVFLIDTLDLNTLDPATFRFVSYGFDTVSTTLTEGRQSFISDVDLRPGKNAIVRVVGSIDPATGLVSTSFRTFDPNTDQLTVDVDAGFLNPNTNGTEGLGFVSFIVDQRPDLAHLTTIANEAAIIFDANEPIITEPHVNRIDHAAPSSEVLASTTFSNDTLLIEWDAEDPHAGVRTVELVIVRNATDTITLVMPGAALGPVELVDEPFNTFRLYTVAIDSTGNRELPPASGYDVEVAMIGTSIPEHTSGAGNILFPNPTKDVFTLDYTLDEPGMVSIELVDQQGRVVSTLLAGAERATGKHRAEFSLPPSLAPGAYGVVVRSGDLVRVSMLLRQ